MNKGGILVILGTFFVLGMLAMLLTGVLAG